jgi:hypothetical protein
MTATVWTITSGTTTLTVKADLSPTFVIKMNGKTYVTVLVQELPGTAAENPREFYEGQYDSVGNAAAFNGTVRKINTADERAQSVNVVNVTRPPG